MSKGQRKQCAHTLTDQFEQLKMQLEPSKDSRDRELCSRCNVEPPIGDHEPIFRDNLGLKYCNSCSWVSINKLLSTIWNIK